MTSEALKVTSHVGRDLLQSAQLFRYEHAVVWEYVANGLEYKDPGTKPIVVVSIDLKSRKIEVKDNGRGMLFADLEHYFKMHGENIDRRQGKPGRGLFGTGKSAAFGIGDSLTVTTVRNRRRSKVRLTRQDIEARPNGDAIPVQTLEKEVPHNGANGTTVEVGGVFLKKLDIGSVIRHIERHIAHWPDASVVVNNHECEYEEPDIAREIQVATQGSEYEPLLGNARLLIRVAKAPLDEEFRGIAILSQGVWHETTLAGCDRKPFSEYLFGTFDAPTLAHDKSNIPAFDMSRSMRLNPRNEIVAEIMRFVGSNLERVRRELEREDRERRRTEEQRRLEHQASKIAALINEHFAQWSAKLRKTMAKSGFGSDVLDGKKQRGSGNEDAVFGNEFPAVLAQTTEPGVVPGPGPGPEPVPFPGPGPRPGPNTPEVKPDENAEQNLAAKEPKAKRPRAMGGFRVEFDKLGVHGRRAKYDKATRTIFINLEHPRIAVEAKNAKGPFPLEDPNFLRFAYEIAFTEYAIVLAQELSTVQFYFDPQDALVELRQTIDDLSKAFVSFPLFFVFQGSGIKPPFSAYAES